MARYKITNPTPARRVIYDKNQVAVTIEANGGVVDNVELGDEVAEELKDRVDGQRKGEETDVVLSPASGKKARPVRGESEDAGTGTRAAAAQALLDNADELSVADFKEQAQTILGDDYPPGRPSAADVQVALKKAAK